MVYGQVTMVTTNESDDKTGPWWHKGSQGYEPKQLHGQESQSSVVQLSRYSGEAVSITVTVAKPEVLLQDIFN